MKKFILALTAASMLATPALAAPQRTVIKERPGKTVVVQKQQTRHGTQVRRTAYRTPYTNAGHWQRGQRFDRRYAPSYRQVDYRQVRGAYAPPRGQQWVQSGNDAVLIALASGVIGAVLGGALAN